MLIETAKAKVNLSLKVLGKLESGYHDICSLVAFTDFGDQIAFEPSEKYSLAVHGPFAPDLSGENLIDQVVSFMQEEYPNLQVGEFNLIKNLPVASGIGGGSSDAAAALRILNSMKHKELDNIDIKKVSLKLGADIPVCLKQEAAFMSGIGEHVKTLENFPKIVCLLINPGVQISTSEIFNKLNAPESSGKDIEKCCFELNGFSSIEGLVNYIQENDNDLQKVAEDICPVIKNIIARLEQQQGCYIARMSGSGATCFGLFNDLSSAQIAMQNIRLEEPNWWINYGNLS